MLLYKFNQNNFSKQQFTSLFYYIFNENISKIFIFFNIIYSFVWKNSLFSKNYYYNYGMYGHILSTEGNKDIEIEK